ncbi:energy transducer TonB [Thalassospira lohafexi]|uniref:Protein TonB n=1 Tax=Thalassospira lohafexi TaxID=744227 RepID=A0A2N3L438_9PROT|nr:energy transducer TonB [Thalassospira lohafexi]PKR57571.1 energy transducer TonB [Thalassospira lohafexi]
MSKRVDFLIATGLTGLVLAGGVVLAMPDPQPSGWGGAGSIQSISISLGAGQATTGETETDQQAADSVESRMAEEPVEEVEPEPEPEPEPVVEPEPESEPVAEPEPIAEPEPVVEEVVEPEPVPEPEPEPEIVEPEPEPVVVQKLADVLPVQMKPKPPVKKVEAPKPQKAPAPTPPAGATNSSHSEGTVGEVAQSQAASSSSGSGGGAASRAAMVDYKSSVVQMLNRYREYPERAKRRRIEGQNSIRVVIAKDGSIEVFEMISGSGSKLLDRETQRMIERVKQFPPFPEHMIEERITLTIPVIYNIR